MTAVDLGDAEVAQHVRLGHEPVTLGECLPRGFVVAVAEGIDAAIPEVARARLTVAAGGCWVVASVRDVVGGVGDAAAGVAGFAAGVGVCPCGRTLGPRA